METPKRSLWQRIKRLLILLLNWRFLICFGIAWMITNGWSYVLFALGTVTGSTWMLAVSGAYLAFLWLPISPEKLVTVAIAMFLLRWLFPNDERTLGVLKEMYALLREKVLSRKKRKKKNKENTDGSDNDK